MKGAYVLVNSLIDTEDDVLEAVMEIPGVKEARRVHGLGLIVLVEAETIQEIDDIVLSKIRSINGVQFVLKMICVD